MRIRQVTAAILLVVVGGWLVHSLFFSTRAQLRRLGVHYNEDSTAFASETLYEFTCWYEGKEVRLEGPRFKGSLLEMREVTRGVDGQTRFTVGPRTHKSYFVTIGIISPPKDGKAFTVVDSHMIGVHYLPEGLRSGP